MNTSARISPRLTAMAGLVVALSLGTGCGDLVRYPHYAGPPRFTVRVRLPEGATPAPSSVVDFQVLNASVDRPRISLPGRDRERHRGGRERLFDLEAQPDEDTLHQVDVTSMTFTRMTIMRIERRDFAQRGELAQAVALNVFVVYALHAAEVYPLGLKGPVMRVRPGYQLVRRVCSADSVRFEPLSDDTVVDLDPVAPASEYETLALARCGLMMLPAQDRGRPVPVIPEGHDRGGGRAPGALAMRFSPVDARLFFTLGTRTSAIEPALEIDALDTATGAIRVLERGAFYGLDISPDGRFLYTMLRDLRQPHGYQPARIDVSGAPGIPAVMPIAANSLFSPDGRKVVISFYANGEHQAVLRDLVTGEGRLLPHGTPLVWSPDSAALLMLGGGDLQRRESPLFLVTLDGQVSPRGTIPSGAQTGGWLWTNRGPQVVYEHDGALQVFSADTGRFLPLITDDDMWTGMAFQMVLPGAGPNQPGPGLFFTWSTRCAGFGGVSCTARLHRFNLADGSSSVVVSAREPAPVAVSHDGKRLALAGDGVIYLRDLAP